MICNFGLIYSRNPGSWATYITYFLSQDLTDMKNHHLLLSSIILIKILPLLSSQFHKKCTQNILDLTILLDQEEIKIICKKSASDIVNDFKTFDDKNLTDINNTTLDIMIKKCYETNEKAVHYPLYSEQDSETLRNINITKVLDTQQPITKLNIQGNFNRKQNALNLGLAFLDNMKSLKSLILNYHNLTILENHFRNETDLENLDLSFNNIKVIKNEAFKGLKILNRLSLKGNEIQDLDQNVLADLRNLTVLDISQNGFHRIENDTFKSLSNLNILNLSQNNLEHLDKDLFTVLQKLEELDLSNNPNLIFSEDIFEDLISIKNLSMSSCNLQKIPENLFAKNTNLIYLNLSKNNIKYLENETFQSLSFLNALDLSYNNIETLPRNIFYSSRHLENLNLAHNNFKAFSSEVIRNVFDLKLLDMSYNSITNFENRLTRFKAERLILKYNNVTEFPQCLIYVATLSHLDLSYNFLTSVTMITDLIPKTTNMTIDLSNNSIKNINTTTLENSRTKSIQSNWEIVLNLTKTFLSCDCYTYSMMTRFEKSTETLLQMTSYEQTCVDVKENVHCPLVKIKNCPGECNCVYSDSLIFVDCRAKNLTRFPIISNLETENGIFKHEKTHVWMEGNYLNEDNQEELENYDNVSILDLRKNEITRLRYIPPKVQFLHLDNNRLRTLDRTIVEKLRTNDNLLRVSLDDNPWVCDCSAVYLQEFMRRSEKVLNLSEVLCSDTGEELVFKKLCDHYNLKIALPVTFTAIFAILSALLALYYRYKTNIKVFLYSKNMCLWCVAEDEIDKEKTYDIFISYSHKDEEFVQKEILSELENGENDSFKICIHYRNWFPGEFISKQIISSVLDSRRTLVILSNNFMESVWGKMEFRTAHTQAISEGRARVIVILYGDLDENSLDDEIKAYLKTNTYVKWGDPWFWNKLKYALPHSKLRRMNNLAKEENIIVVE